MVRTEFVLQYGDTLGAEASDRLLAQRLARSAGERGCAAAAPGGADCRHTGFEQGGVCP